MSTESTRAELNAKIKELKQKTEELAQVKASLHEVEEKYRLLVNNANDAIFVLQDGKVKFANPKALEVGGVLAEELDRFPYTDYLHPDERQIVTRRYEKRLKGDKVINMYPLRIINRQGEVVWVELNAVRIEWDGRPATLNIIRDITSQKLIAGKYYQADNLAAVRTLAGGLAHSFNNLLMGIQGRVSLLNLDIAKADPHMEHLDAIEECVKEAAKLSQQMLGFAQCGKYQVSTVNLNEVLDSAVRTFRRSTKTVTLRREFEKTLWPVAADKNQIDQVIISILLNAWQAIPETGTVTLRTQNTEMSRSRGKTRDPAPTKFVKVTIRDTGIGMDKTVCKRVFEPFFTTKEMGRHRGLGLASAYGIIANHDGFIDIDSVPDRGTTVTILLPAKQSRQAEA